MGHKKKRSHPDLEELLARPWCYYCERDFEDLKLLISHQKAKHFKCERCGKRLNTAGGLSVHMNQVHKETLQCVENALPNRSGLDIEIFGMEGVPEDILQQHNQRIIQNFYQAQAERAAATGNPPRGHAVQGPAKKIKYETPEELKKRLAEHRAKFAAQKAAAANGTAPQVPQADGAAAAPAPFPAAQPPAYPYPAMPPTVPGYPAAAIPPFPPTAPAGVYPAPGAPPVPGAPGASFPLPARPPGAPGAGAALPQRPPFYNGAGAPGEGPVQKVGGDDIDQLIRMAEAGIKPQAQQQQGEKKEEGAAAGEKKKKEVRMVYADTEVSPEEKMALLPRYRWVEEAAA